MTITTIVMAPIGRLMKKHHLHVATGMLVFASIDCRALGLPLSVNTPPSRGPATLAIPYIAPMKPVYIGRFTRGTLYATMISAPEKIPALPTPATARPMIRAIEFGATPQIREPNSKIPIAMR